MKLINASSVVVVLYLTLLRMDLTEKSTDNEMWLSEAYTFRIINTVTRSCICEVLEANSSDFFTVALRPHGIFGPRDPHLVPTTVELAKAGKNKFIVGDGKNVVDFTFVTNVVQGHILAAEQIGPNSQINGNAYFLTNDEPLFFWTFLSKILVGLGYKAPKYHLPFTVIYFIAVIIQMFCALLKPFKEIHTSITPFAICVAATHHFYCCKKAITELGYKPSVSVEEGIQKTLEYFSYLKKETDDVKE